MVWYFISSYDLLLRKLLYMVTLQTVNIYITNVLLYIQVAPCKLKVNIILFWLLLTYEIKFVVNIIFKKSILVLTFCKYFTTYLLNQIICFYSGNDSKYMWPDLQKGTTSVKTFVAWPLNKLLLKHLKHLSFVYILLIYMHNYSKCMQNCFCYVLTVFFSQIRSQCCDRSGPFLQIKSHILI